MAGQSASKDTRIDFRIKTDQKKLLNHAASLEHMTLSTFIMACALKEARKIVTERTHFLLSEKQWDDFCARLEQPAKPIPKLKKLLSQKSIFNE